MCFVVVWVFGVLVVVVCVVVVRVAVCVVLGVFSGKNIVASLNYLPEGEYYYTSVVGRCDCNASKNWSPNLPDASPLRVITEYSKSKEVDCSMGASLLCTELNERNRNCQKTPIGNISQLTQELKEELPF